MQTSRQKLTLFGKRRETERISGMFMSERMPHGIMLNGDKGLGKRTLAEWCAMLVLCKNPVHENGGVQPCMECVSCKKILAHEHPDVIYAKGEKYTVGAVRDYVQQAAYYPNDGDLRVFIYEDADEMSDDQQNALLKAIEEPSKYNRYIFTCSNTSAVLTTILSRLVNIKLSDMTADECSACLEYGGMEKQAAEDAVKKYGTNPGRILQIMSDENKSELFDKADRIAEAFCDVREYDAAAEFFTCTDREALFGVISILYEKISSAAKPGTSEDRTAAMLKKTISLKKLYLLSEKLSELMLLDGANLNVKLAQTSFPAQLFDILL